MSVRHTKADMLYSVRREHTGWTITDATRAGHNRLAYVMQPEHTQATPTKVFRLHETDVLEITGKLVALNTAGWNTLTTHSAIMDGVEHFEVFPKGPGSGERYGRVHYGPPVGIWFLANIGKASPKEGGGSVAHFLRYDLEGHVERRLVHFWKHLSFELTIRRSVNWSSLVSDLGGKVDRA